jgi:hypothetical protein
MRFSFENNNITIPSTRFVSVQIKIHQRTVSNHVLGAQNIRNVFRAFTDSVERPLIDTKIRYINSCPCIPVFMTLPMKEAYRAHGHNVFNSISLPK